jgi:hypothetical protein
MNRLEPFLSVFWELGRIVGEITEVPITYQSSFPLAFGRVENNPALAGTRAGFIMSKIDSVDSRRDIKTGTYLEDSALLVF